MIPNKQYCHSGDELSTTITLTGLVAYLILHTTNKVTLNNEIKFHIGDHRNHTYTQDVA